MSVVSVKEIHPGRDGGDDLGKEGGKSSITRKFRVITSSVYDGADTVLQSCANLGTVHPTATWLYVNSRRAVNDSQSKLMWIATLKYTSQRERTENPLAQPVEITWSTESEQAHAFTDKDDDAILNSAGDYYEDGVPIELSHWVAKVTKNVAYVPSWINSYRNAINSDVFYLDGLTIAVRSAKLKSIAIGKWSTQNGIWYRTIDMSIKITDTWVASILDQGLRRKIDVDGTDVLTRCINEDGTEATKPVLLDGSGDQLASPTPATAVFNDHYIYPELPYSVLPLY
jgi:hypothetical protein